MSQQKPDNNDLDFRRLNDIDEIKQNLCILYICCLLYKIQDGYKSILYSV